MYSWALVFFLIHSDSLCLLMNACGPFIFKVIIDMVGFVFGICVTVFVHGPFLYLWVLGFGGFFFFLVFHFFFLPSPILWAFYILLFPLLFYYFNFIQILFGKQLLWSLQYTFMTDPSPFANSAALLHGWYERPRAPSPLCGALGPEDTAAFNSQFNTHAHGPPRHTQSPPVSPKVTMPLTQTALNMVIFLPGIFLCTCFTYLIGGSTCNVLSWLSLLALP